MQKREKRTTLFVKIEMTLESGKNGHFWTLCKGCGNAIWEKMANFRRELRSVKTMTKIVRIRSEIYSWSLESFKNGCVQKTETKATLFVKEAK